MNELTVTIENVKGQLVVSSRVIAEQLGKRHDHIIRDLEKILENPNVGSLIISSTYEVSGQKRKYKEYLLTKDGFTLYMFNIQGYNDFKMAYINRFNQMEQQLAHPTLTPLQLMAQIANGMVEMEQKLLAQSTKLDTITKDVTRLEHTLRILQASDHLTVIAFANMKGIKPRCYSSSQIGRLATKICKEKGLKVGKTVDSKFGYINTYPEEILEDIFINKGLL